MNPELYMFQREVFSIFDIEYIPIFDSINCTISINNIHKQASKFSKY